jgi:hypothetical protein
MDKVQKTAFTDYNAPSSDPFRLHKINKIEINTKNKILETCTGYKWI